MNQHVNDFTDNVRVYYNELKKYKPISRKEEKRLIKLYKNGSLMAKNKLLESNLRFVFDIARKYTGRGVPICDLISEGNLGLIKALDKFDDSKNVKFISYAVWWVKQAMLDSISKNKAYLGNEIKPRESNDLVMENRLAYEDDDDVSYYEVEGNDNDSLSVEEEQRNMVSELLEPLNDRERDIVKSFYGIGGDKILTLTEISKKYGISVQRAMQIKKKSFKKMRSFAMLYD